MIQIDMEMPENCYECPLMVWCDQCEGYSNRCAYNQEIDCGFVIKAYKGNIVKEDHSNGTLWSRPERCPLRADDDENYEALVKEVELNTSLIKQMMSLREKIQELEKKLHDVGASPFDAQIGRK